MNKQTFDMQTAMNYNPVGMYMFDAGFMEFAEDAIYKEQGSIEERFELVKRLDAAYGTDVDYAARSPEEWVNEYRDDIKDLYS